ncbi:MAG: hypothetical protein MI807_09580 [Verrucomicrobiales bacterium]|nr:hypothetical protein [Verrucomicrobiales bacterium]
MKTLLPGLGCGLGVVLFLFPPLALSQDSPPRSGIVNQRDFEVSRNACGPASILNLLKFSREEYLTIYHKMQTTEDGARIGMLINQYFRDRKSVVKPGQNRWGVHGIFSEDLAAGLNEWLAGSGVPELQSDYLDRIAGETEGEHMRRVHEMIAKSLRNGVSPILSLRSFVVRTRTPGKPGWETGLHHNVVVADVDEKPGALGFQVTVLDPAGAREVPVFIHRDGGRLPFRAMRGVDGNGEWLKGFSFLQVMAPEVPALRPKNLEWSERYLVTANFLIGDF